MQTVNMRIRVHGPEFADDVTILNQPDPLPVLVNFDLKEGPIGKAIFRRVGENFLDVEVTLRQDPPPEMELSFSGRIRGERDGFITVFEIMAFSFIKKLGG